VSERALRGIGFALTIGVIVAAIGILNVGAFPAITAAAECQAGGGGGGGGGSQSPSPTGSGSASPSGSGSPSPSGSGGGGPNPGQITSLLPGEESPSPSGSASPSGSGSPSGSPTSGGGGDAQECSSNVTIDYEKKSATGADPRDHFKGTVKSRNAQCESGRTVVVKKVRKGKKAATVGRTVSRRGGAWRVQESVKRGRYYALAQPRSIRGEIDCLKGKSKTIRV